jgi:uncharacterized protein YutE (UPF0331/DUF86 family)
VDRRLIEEKLETLRDAPAPQTMGEAFERLAALDYLDADTADRLKKAVGFRNVAVHNYQTIDWQVVHEIRVRHLGDFHDFAAAISRRL